MAREEELAGFRKVPRFCRCSGDEEGGIKRGIGDEEGKKLCQFLRLRTFRPLSIENIFPGPIYIYIYLGYVSKQIFRQALPPLSNQYVLWKLHFY